MTRSVTPVVGIPADYVGGDRPYHRVYDKYLEAVESLGATPILIPANGHRADALAVLRILDGLLLPGSVSNVAPPLYGRTQEMAHPVDNPQRDATTLALIRAAVESGVPVLGICRGHQELNVALGGTLHQQIDRIDGLGIHQFGDECSIEEIFAPAHEVSLTLGSRLYEWVGQPRITVNSAHNQAIDDLAPRLAIEAKADDGTIEAVRVTDSPAFAYGVQWHPEWNFAANPVSLALFGAFGRAVHDHGKARQGAL